jgi:hypothetical protein
MISMVVWLERAAAKPGSSLIDIGYTVASELSAMQDFLQQDAGYKLLMMSMPSRGHPRRTPHEPSERAAALNACHNAFVATGLVSGMSNILMLIGSLLMLAGVDAIVLQNHLQLS